MVVWAQGLVKMDQNHAKLLVPAQKFNIDRELEISALAYQLAVLARDERLRDTFFTIFTNNPCTRNPRLGAEQVLQDDDTLDGIFCDNFAPPSSTVACYYILFEAPSGKCCAPSVGRLIAFNHNRRWQPECKNRNQLGRTLRIAPTAHNQRTITRAKPL